jgi:hypothetical protein
MLHLDREGTKEDGLLSNAKSSAIRPEGRRAKGGSPRQGSNTVAYSHTGGTPAVQCAWCERWFDGTDDRLTGRVRCARCGVATTTPWPSDEQLSAAYADWYRPKAGRFSGLGDKVLRRARSALADRLHRILPPGPVLDVGAGDGTLVEAFVRHGREAVGLEPYASGPHIRNAEVEEVAGNWSAVIFWHSLEHLRQPARALSHAAALLSPGGTLVVAVPNATSLQALRRCCPRSRLWGCESSESATCGAVRSSSDGSTALSASFPATQTCTMPSVAARRVRPPRVPPSGSTPSPLP